MGAVFSEPTPRWAPLSAPVGGKVYLYGGRAKDKPLSDLHTFDVSKECWNKETTQGAPPPGIYSGACAAHGSNIYLYGGTDGSDYQGALHQLDTDTLKWSRLGTSGVAPMKKEDCGMIVYNNSLVVFGGYGFPFRPGWIQRGAHFSRGWSNELHVLDLETGAWSSPIVSGERPPPCSSFTFTKVDDDHAVLFGGHQPGKKCVSDMYVLDLAKMHWRKVVHRESDPWPAGRVGHASVCLGYGEHPQVLITGGLDSSNNVLTDAWLYDVDTAQWREASETLQGRCYHTATANIRSSKFVEVVLFGGTSKSSESSEDLGKTAVLRFELDENVGWGLVDVADESVLGSSERLKVKEELISSNVFLDNIERHMGNLVFVGLPESGKSSLIANLLELSNMKHASPPANVTNGIITVDISTGVSSLSVANVSGGTWSQQKFQIDSVGQLGGEFFPTHCPPENQFDQPKVKPHDPGIVKLLGESGHTLLRYNGHSLYFSDIGDQIEFQDLLAVRIFPGAIFLFLFSLARGLDEEVKITSRSAVGDYCTSAKKFFLHSLSSIDSMVDGISSSQQKPLVLMVGTHRDVLEKQLGRERAAERIAKLNRQLLSLVRQHKYDDLVMMADPGREQFMFTVDNSYHGEDVFRLIRSRIKHFIESRDQFIAEFPLSYVLACLELQQSEGAFINRNTFHNALTRDGILEDCIDHLIQFLQSKIGLVRYFPTNAFKSVIMRNPLILYNLTSHLLLQRFLETATLSQHSDMQKGIYSLEFLKQCISEFELQSELVTPESAVLLLKELRIMAPFYDHESESDKFFAPCILNHLEGPAPYGKSAHDVVQPLVIKFKRGRCPKGMFGVLVHYLLSHMIGNTEWVLEKELICREQVSFKVGHYHDSVTLKNLATYLELSCHPSQLPTRDDIRVICHRVLSAVLSGIAHAAVTLNYDSKRMGHSLALVCQDKKCDKLHDIEELDGVPKYKDCSEQICSLPESAAYWFGNVPVYSFPDLKEGAELGAIEGSEATLTFEVTPDLPLLEDENHKQHILTRDGDHVLDERVSIEENVICFSRVGEADAGRYTITSSNGIGQGHGSFHLTISVPPRYELADDYVKAVVGESPTLSFTVICDPPLPDDTKHSVLDKDGKVIRRFKVTHNLITFRDVEECDSGEYTICCQDTRGVEIKATLELKVTASDTASIRSQQSSGDDPPPKPVPKPSQRKYGTPHEYKLAEQVSAKWRTLGTRIDLTPNTLDNWFLETNRSTERCFERVMQAWLDKNLQTYAPTWEGLYSLLRDVEKPVAAEDLKEAVDNAILD